MTGPEAIQAVADGLARTSMTTQITAALTRQQSLLEAGGLLPWFLLKTSSGLVTDGVTQTVALPTDFLREAEEEQAESGCLFYVDSSGSLQPIEKGDVVPLLNVDSFQEDTADYPTKYGIYKGLIYLFPVVNQVISLTQFYYGKDTTFSGAVGFTNLWLTYAPELLIARAGRQIARTIRDFEVAKMFEGDVSDSWQSLVAADTAQREAGRVRFMGEEL